MSNGHQNGRQKTGQILSLWGSTILSKTFHPKQLSILRSMFIRVLTFPIASMYGIFAYIYHKNQSNVGNYTIHGWYGFAEILFFECSSAAAVLQKPTRSSIRKCLLVFNSFLSEVNPCDFFPLASHQAGHLRASDVGIPGIPYIYHRAKSEYIWVVWAFVVCLDFWNLFWDALGILGFSKITCLERPFRANKQKRCTVGHQENMRIPESYCPRPQMFKTCYVLEADMKLTKIFYSLIYTRVFVDPLSYGRLFQEVGDEKNRAAAQVLFRRRRREIPAGVFELHNLGLVSVTTRFLEIPWFDAPYCYQVVVSSIFYFHPYMGKRSNWIQLDWYFSNVKKSSRKGAGNWKKPQIWFFVAEAEVYNTSWFLVNLHG